MIRHYDRQRAPRPPLRFNSQAKYARNAVLVLAPGYGNADGGRSIYPRDLSYSNTSFNGNEFGFYNEFGLRHIVLNTGLTTAGTQLERINITSESRLENAIINDRGFTVRMLARIDNAGPSEFLGFGRVISKEVASATNTNFEIVTKDDGTLKTERRTTGTPNNTTTSSAAGLYTVGASARFHWFVVTFLNGSTLAADIHIYVDGVETTSYVAPQDGAGAYIASDLTKPFVVGDRQVGSRECGVSLVYLDVLNVPLSPVEVANSYGAERWDLVAPFMRRAVMPVAAPAGGPTVPIFHHHYNQMRAA